MSAIHVMTIASVLWGLHGIPVALSAASSGYVSLTRFLLSSLFLLPFLFCCSREHFSVAKSCSYLSLLSAFFWALCGILFVCAIAIEGGSVVSTVALSYCFPVFTIAIKYLKTGKLTRKDFTCAILVLYGVYCFLPEVSSAAFLSSILALLSGLSLALHLECAEQTESAGGIVFSILIGHIAGIVNPPDKQKYGHYINADLNQSPEDWLQQATFVSGSWWEYWGAWLVRYSGEQKPAIPVGSKTFKPISDAPGAYVRMRSGS